MTFSKLTSLRPFKVFAFICASLFVAIGFQNCSDSLPDNVNNKSTTQQSVASALGLSPLSATLGTGISLDFSGFGGVPPYSFTVLQGTGTIIASTGHFIAPSMAEVDTVQIADSAGHYATAMVNVMVATVPTNPINGVCGAASGVIFSTPPTTGLCVSGNASAVNGTGPWNWNCGDVNTGTVVACSTAAIPPPSVPTCNGFGPTVSGDDTFVWGPSGYGWPYGNYSCTTTCTPTYFSTLGGNTNLYCPGLP